MVSVHLRMLITDLIFTNYQNLVAQQYIFIVLSCYYTVPSIYKILIICCKSNKNL